jgi:phosphomannomutase
MIKEKINLSKSFDVDNILNKVALKYENEKIDLVDGVRIDFNESWVQLRKSNTEPIIRIYSEAKNKSEAQNLIKEIESLIQEIISL